MSFGKKYNSLYSQGCVFKAGLHTLGWADMACSLTERLSGHSKETGLVIYLAFLAKVANLYYIILTVFKDYWPDTVAKFISGTQETFI